MRFKLDENMPVDFAGMLESEGHDVDDVIAEGLAGEDDQRVISVAARERRVLLTFDLDFADIRNYPPGGHAGIVVFRLQDQRWQAIEAHARRFLTQTDMAKLDRSLAVVDETRIRYRRPRH